MSVVALRAALVCGLFATACARQKTLVIVPDPPPPRYAPRPPPPPPPPPAPPMEPFLGHCEVGLALVADATNFRAHVGADRRVRRLGSRALFVAGGFHFQHAWFRPPRPRIRDGRSEDSTYDLLGPEIRIGIADTSSRVGSSEAYLGYAVPRLAHLHTISETHLRTGFGHRVSFGLKAPRAPVMFARGCRAFPMSPLERAESGRYSDRAYGGKNPIACLGVIAPSQIEVAYEHLPGDSRWALTFGWGF